MNRVLAGLGVALVVVGVVLFVRNQLRLKPRRSAPARPHVAGHVWRDGQPFAGATVRFAPGAAPPVTSGAHGAFDLGEAPGFAAEIVADAPGAESDSMRLPSGAALSTIELHLGRCQATMSGTVVD